MSETVTMTLAEFLLARIADDEEVARIARQSSGKWVAYEVNDSPERGGEPTGARLDEDEEGVPGFGYAVAEHARKVHVIGSLDPASNRDAIAILSNPSEWIAVPDGPTGINQLSHAARHDPARVLADCEAKRRIVALHADDQPYCSDNFSNADHGFFEGPCENLRLLALPYADHPDYRDEWKP